MLAPRAGERIRAIRWTDCLRRCDQCEVGYSNARANPTKIYGDPLQNIPQAVWTDALDTLGEALNQRNRPDKRVKFGFSTSEDALTWTVFRYLTDEGQLLNVLRRAGLAIPDELALPVAVLLWGVPLPLDPDRESAGWQLRRRLEEISDQLGEHPEGRSEPDVVIDLGPCGLIIIEVKHRSATDVKLPDYPGWECYYPAASPIPYAAAIRDSGCYELARNWRFGLELTTHSERPFTLLCLGPQTLFEAEGAAVLQPFIACLAGQGPAQFQTLTWNALLGAIDGPPEWLGEYVGSREYVMPEVRR
jgi:hypothetical protein